MPSFVADGFFDLDLDLHLILPIIVNFLGCGLFTKLIFNVII